MTANEATPIALAHAAVHGFGQYPDFCPPCRADLDQQAAEEERAYGQRLDSNVRALLERTATAQTAVHAIRRVLADLVTDYDIEITEGPDQGDLEHELDVAQRALRNVERIARRRVSLLDDRENRLRETGRDILRVYLEVIGSDIPDDVADEITGWEQELRVSRGETHA